MSAVTTILTAYRSIVGTDAVRPPDRDRPDVTCAAARARTLAPLGPAPAARHLLDTFVIASSVSFASSVDDVSAFVALSQRVISLQRRVDVRPQRASNEHPASRSSCLVTRAVPAF